MISRFLSIWVLFLGYTTNLALVASCDYSVAEISEVLALRFAAPF